MVKYGKIMSLWDPGLWAGSSFSVVSVFEVRLVERTLRVWGAGNPVPGGSIYTFKL